MNRQTVTGSLLLPTALGLLMYSVMLTGLTGDIGFDADDWWIFSWSYWEKYPESVVAYAKEFLRPVEGVYWLTMFDLVGFNRIAFHLCSLFLWTAASLAMGACLAKAFPRDRIFVVFAIAFSFFLPTVSSLTYIIFTDNSRLSILLFWVATLAFQSWAEKSARWTGLLVPVFAYVMSFLTYETASLMIFGIPLLVLPARAHQGKNPYDPSFLVRLATGMATGLAISLVIRFTLLSGGAVAHRHFLPPLELVVSYIALLPQYLIAPFTHISSDAWAAPFGIAAAAGLGFYLYWLGRSEADSQETGDSPKIFCTTSYKLAVGFVFFFLGMLPYQLAGYGSSVPKLSETVLAVYGWIENGDTSWFNFNWASRIYSSASCGIAVLLAAVAATPRSLVPRLVAQGVAVISIGFMVCFHVGLSRDWQEAADVRNDLVRSLIQQVPDVKSHTNFVFLDLETYHKRAAVIRRWAGLRELVRMLYDDKTLGAWYLYPHARIPPNKVFQQAIVLTAGFVSRGVPLTAPAPHDTLLLLKRTGRHLTLVEKISQNDGQAPTGVAWKGAKMLHCNKKRISSVCGLFIREKYNCQHRYITGLISTLNLSNRGK